jgi:hypothetical protein
MILLFGQDDPYGGQTVQVPGNYLSFIKTVNLEKPEKVRWFTNGLAGMESKGLQVDRPLSQSRTDPYSKIGLIFKCGDAGRGSPVEWLCPRINVMPSVRSYLSAREDEPFTVLFNNDFNNRSPNRTYHLSSITDLQRKPCMVLTD